MRRARHLTLCLLALAAGVAVAIVASEPVGAGSQPASIRAVDFAFENPATGDPSVTIEAGETVNFSYPDGGSAHNVDFLTTQPTSCTQTAGTNFGAVPPLPTFPSPEGWAGTCQFNSPGTYAFVCQAHPSMVGEVQVVPVSPTTTTTTTGPTTTATTTATDPTTTGSTETPTGPPTGGSTGTVPQATTPAAPPPPGLPTLRASSRQRGLVLRGTVTTPAGPSRIVVTASASNRQLQTRRPRRVRQVRIGSQTKRSTGTGRTAFAITLTRAAERALLRRDRLSVRLQAVVTPPGGRAVTRTATVVLRAP